MNVLEKLINDARATAGQDDSLFFGGSVWQMDGGRACPIGWWDCSQPVLRNARTGEYDYGDLGGPGHDDCVKNCRHGMRPNTFNDDIAKS